MEEDKKRRKDTVGLHVLFQNFYSCIRLLCFLVLITSVSDTNSNTIFNKAIFSVIAPKNHSLQSKRLVICSPIMVRRYVGHFQKPITNTGQLT